MGRPKSGLPVAGELLLARQLRILREAGVDECWVSWGTEGNPEIPTGAEVRIIRDARAGEGPLAGIERVLACARHPWVLILAVDLPAMSPAFLRGLIAGCELGKGIVPRLEGRFEPLAAVYPASAWSEASVRLSRGDRALQGFVSAVVAGGSLRVHEVTPEEVPLFTNWNHPEDFRAG